LSARFEAEEGIPDGFELETVEREGPASDDGVPGREIELYRLRRVDGETVDRELVHRDVYPPTMTRPSAPR